MPKLEVNVDTFAYHGPAPREGAERPLRFASRGDVVELDDEQAARAEATLVGQVYPDPTNPGGSVRRLEPAAVAAGSQSASEDELAKWNDKRAELRAELARLEANAPLVVRGSPAAPVTAPALPPSLTGVRQVPPMGADASSSATVTGPAASIDVAASTVPEVLAHLTQNPAQVEAIASAEQVRPDGARKTILDAVERVREASAENA